MKPKSQFNNIDIVITGNVAWRDDLAWDEKIFYGIIRGLVKNDYYCCYASNEYFCKVLGKGDDSTIRRYLRALKRAEVIVVDNIYLPDEHDGLFYTRAIIPTELFKKFEKKKNEMLDLKESLKKCPKGGQKYPPTPCKNTRQYNNVQPCKKNINNIYKADINPQPPCKGGNQADTLINTEAVTLIELEQVKTFGTFGNVRLTDAQARAFKSEFGDKFALALIEQLDSYIQSDGRKRKRFAKRSSDEVYAKLRDWALRRSEPPAPTKVLIGGRDIERRAYSDEELNALFTPLSEDDADDG